MADIFRVPINTNSVNIMSRDTKVTSRSQIMLCMEAISGIPVFSSAMGSICEIEGGFEAIKDIINLGNIAAGISFMDLDLDKQNVLALEQYINVLDNDVLSKNSELHYRVMQIPSRIKSTGGSKAINISRDDSGITIEVSDTSTNKNPLTHEEASYIHSIIRDKLHNLPVTINLSSDVDIILPSVVIERGRDPSEGYVGPSSVELFIDCTIGDIHEAMLFIMADSKDKKLVGKDDFARKEKARKYDA